MVAGGIWRAGRGTNLERRRIALLRLLRMRRRPLDRRRPDRGEVLRVQLLERLGIDPESLGPQLSREHWKAAKAVLAAHFKTRSRDEWAALLERTDACVIAGALVRRSAAAPSPARARHLRRDRRHRAGGAGAALLAHRARRRRRRPRPRHPENTDRALSALVRAGQDRRAAASRADRLSHGPSLHRRRDRLSRRGARLLRAGVAARHPPQVRARPAHLQARDAALGAHPARQGLGHAVVGARVGRHGLERGQAVHLQGRAARWRRRRSRSRST